MPQPKSIFLGQFLQESKKIIISDPCYKINKNKKVNQILKNVQQGYWNVWVEKNKVPSLGGVRREQYTELKAKYIPTDFEEDSNITDYYDMSDMLDKYNKNSEETIDTGIMYVESGQFTIY